MSEQPDIFSRDGYIVRQRNCGHLLYGAFASDWNGCGWIAMYNVLRSLGHTLTPEELCRAMSARLYHRGAFGTPVALMGQVLTEYGLPFQFGSGKKAALCLGPGSPRGILRYWEGNEPHYVSYLRQSDGRCRFLNVTDEQEEILCPFERFVLVRPKRPSIRIFALDI